MEQIVILKKFLLIIKVQQEKLSQINKFGGSSLIVIKNNKILDGILSSTDLRKL